VERIFYYPTFERIDPRFLGMKRPPLPHLAKLLHLGLYFQMPSSLRGRVVGMDELVLPEVKDAISVALHRFTTDHRRWLFTV